MPIFISGVLIFSENFIAPDDVRKDIRILINVSRRSSSLPINRGDLTYSLPEGKENN